MIPNLPIQMISPCEPANRGTVFLSRQPIFLPAKDTPGVDTGNKPVECLCVIQKVLPYVFFFGTLFVAASVQQNATFFLKCYLPFREKGNENSGNNRYAANYIVAQVRGKTRHFHTRPGAQFYGKVSHIVLLVPVYFDTLQISLSPSLAE